MARRSKRRVLSGTPFIWFTVINLLIGLRYSPFFCLRRVHVIGAQRQDEGDITAMFESQMDRAALSVTPAQVETDFQRLPEVDFCTFGTNVFGSGRLVLHYRHPVGCIEPAKLALDEKGGIWRSRQALKGLPSVVLPAGTLTAGLAMAHSTPVQAVADLCVKLPGAYPNFEGDIVLDDAGRVCLNRRDSGSIVLGGPEAMDEKLTRLSGLLHEKPSLFAGPVEINLTAPAHPVFSQVTKPKNEDVRDPKP